MSRFYKMYFKKLTSRIMIFGAALTSAASCVYIDDKLGNNFVPANQIYEIRTKPIPLNCIEMRPSDNLSAYSSSRITIGAVRDDVFGLTTKGSAFTVVPVNDTIDLGENTKIRQFHFTFSRDTVSCRDRNQKNILQNVNVYELKKKIGKKCIYSSDFKEDEYRGKRIGTFTYNGGDSLSFDLDPIYARDKYLTLFQGDDKDIQMDLDKYLDRMPGIYMDVDAPLNDGGRINMFRVTIDVSDSYYVTGNYAELKITADYGKRKQVDTSFLFYFGPAERTATTSQYAFNVSRTKSSDNDNIKNPTDKIFIEGGTGYKPVINSKGLQETILEVIRTEATDRDGNPVEVSPKDVIINKARLVFPYEYKNRDKMSHYPPVLSPTIQLSSTVTSEDGDSDKVISYAGLTDASIESENKGDINRSLCCYTPDISHHVQEIIRLTDDSLKKKGKTYSDYDIWMLPMAYETIQTSSSSSDMSDYYQNLAYLNYYNNLYSGYGGYGYGYGYGYGSYGYDNYYNYYLASMYASSGSSSTTSTTSLQLDKDRYYAGELLGTSYNSGTGKNGPHIEIIFSYTTKNLE